jgi:hypothetical protein
MLWIDELIQRTLLEEKLTLNMIDKLAHYREIEIS